MPQPTETLAHPAARESQADVKPSVEAPLEKLPVQEEEGNIKHLLYENSWNLVVGQTGSGKTTWLPRFMLDVVSEKNPNARVLVTQPKRIAVDNVATTVAKQLGEDAVGYRYKNANTITDETKIGFMVDGSLLNELRRNPTLDNPEFGKWDAVMIDEIHLESENMLVVLAKLKKAQALRKQQGKRELLIVLTSGTVNVDKIKQYVPRIATKEVPGRQHPIADHFLDHEVDPDNITNEAVNVMEKILSETTEGNVAVFMPGRSHINDTIAKAKERFKDVPGLSFFSVTGGESGSQRAPVNEKAPPGQRWFFIGTNAMQESITIKDTKDVIISGYNKISRYDTATGLASLRLAKATRTDLEQQRGRSGREAPGRAWFLMTKGEYEGRPEFAESEIGRINLAPLVLRLKGEGEDPYTFDFLTKPPKDHIDAAIITLKKLGALDKDGNITQEIGESMLKLSLDDLHFARMLIEAKKKGCVEEVSFLIGFLSGRSVFAYDPKRERFAQKYASYTHPDSDFLTILKVWNAYLDEPARQKISPDEWARKNGFSLAAIAEAVAAKNELLDEDLFEDLHLSKDKKRYDVEGERATAVRESILAGLGDRVLEARPDRDYRLTHQPSSKIIIGRTSVFAGKRAPKLAAGEISDTESGRAFANFLELVTDDMSIAKKEDKNQAAGGENKETNSNGTVEKQKQDQAASDLEEVTTKPKYPTEIKSVLDDEKPEEQARKGFWSKIGGLFKSIFGK